MAPEAQVGGPIALVENGDRITIDAVENTISIDLEDEVLQLRKEKWNQPSLKVKKGSLYKYARMVSSASQGCVTDKF